MLSGPSASRASRSCSRDFLRSTARHPTQLSSRPFLGGVATLSLQRRGISTRRLAPASALNSSIPGTNTSNSTRPWQSKRSSSTNTFPYADRKDELYALIDTINNNEADMARLMDELDLLDDHHGVLNYDGPDPEDVFTPFIGHRNQQALEAKVQAVRQQFGDHVPEGYMNPAEFELYTRLYGEPIAEEEVVEVEEEDDGRDPDRLYRQDEEGRWEEVEPEESPEEFDAEDDIPVAYDMEAPPAETDTMKRAREVAEELGGELMLERSSDETNGQGFQRTHPLTMEGRTLPSINIPKHTVTGPISAILSNYSNKHIHAAAREIFGGSNLPNSARTLPRSAQLPQLPIPLSAAYRHMTDMEANAFLAVLYPAFYATSLSILSEVRRRLGTKWIRNLISRPGGAHILDVGGGGAAVQAWRDILSAEWKAMFPGHPESEPIPFGKSTVLTGSDSLQLRSSIMLDNTTFLPRLPDYVHVRDKPTLDDETEPPKRKQYDIIVASHNLLGITEDYLRKEHVENLWSLLNPDGGVLILYEKGRQRGFEAIAGAREMILNNYIASPESSAESSIDDSNLDKEPGMIIAPCTNHEQCPMYRIPGLVRNRKDFCHFEQRYHRPDFLQRVVGSKSQNHEDLAFSYIAFQRGVDLRQKGVKQGKEATDAAFKGYEHINPEPEDSTSSSATTDKAQKFHHLSLPRAVYQPMKRKGHVILDLCTPAGQIERWTVPRSFSKQAYKDARKSSWGDLWALGAKTRIPRNLSTGTKDGEGKKERMARRAAAKAAMSEERS